MRNAARHDRHQGFIVVAVMWILMLLAALASVYSSYVATSATAQSVDEGRLRANWLVSAGLELAVYGMSMPDKVGRPTRGSFDFRLGRAAVAVHYVSEAARIDLNSAPKPLLMGLFAALGAPGEAGEQYADRIIGWRTAPRDKADNNEDARYRSSGLSYGPRGGPFAHLNELWLVQGLPPAVIRSAMPYITIYSGRSGINAIDAPPLVVAALPGMTPGRINAFMSQRDSLPPDPQAIATALGLDKPDAATAKSDAYRVNIDIRFDNGTRTSAEVVIRVGGESLYNVLFWQDDWDTPLATPSAGGS